MNADESAETTITMDLPTLMKIRAEAWDQGRDAPAHYDGPNGGHYDACLGWEDCDCATYVNPFRNQFPGDQR